MTGIVPLVDAVEEAAYGAKAVGLGDALRAGLPVPPGIALPGPEVDLIASGDPTAIAALRGALAALPTPLAVRSSAVGEDSAGASFAGQHITVLNVPTADHVESAVREVWWSANSDSAITYRKRLGVFAQPSGRVIPDSFRIARGGEVIERRAGLKRFAIRSAPDGGTVDEDVDPDLVEALCLDDGHLQALSTLADDCERIYGDGRDIEWAFADGQLYLLQCRAVTRSAGVTPVAAAPPDAPGEAIGHVPLFAGLATTDRDAVARLFRRRVFAAGETVTKEGSDAAAFYLIESGTATVTVGGEFRRTLGPDDHFGEIALIDGRARSATVTADDELVCQGITLWDFQPLVQRNPTMAWALLQTLAGQLRGSGSTREGSGGPG